MDNLKGVWTRYNLKDGILYMQLAYGEYELRATIEEALFIIGGLGRESCARHQAEKITGNEQTVLPKKIFMLESNDEVWFDVEIDQ